MKKRESEDRRVVSTRAAARDALVSLIFEKGLGNFTVTELCQKAMLNRGTFYNHWKSIDDLLSECEQELLDGMAACVRDFPKLNRESLRGFIGDEKPVPGIIEAFEYLSERASLLDALTCVNGDGHFVLKLRKSLAQSFLEYIIHGRYNCETSRDEEYFAWYHASAFLGTVQCWLLQGCSESPEEMSLRLIRLLYFQPAESHS